MSSTQQDNNCVSIRSRIRKSQRVIDPQFDNVQEILLSFVNINNGDNTNKGSKAKGKGGEPALLLTPIPKFTRSRSNNVPIKTTRTRSLNNPALLNNSTVEVKRKQSIISDIGSDNGDLDGSSGLNNSNVEDSLESEGEFIGLEKLEIGDDNNDSLNKSHHSAQPMQLNISRLKPPQAERGTSGGKLPPTGNNSRYSSPLNVIRTSSGVSINGNGGGEGSVISGGTNSDHLSSSVRSRSSRSRSRSRSRRRPTRMRSYGASSAFANASHNNNGMMNGSLNGEECDIGDCSDGEKQVEPITIPLKDILSVDEEVPSRNKGGGSSVNGSGGGSDFYSSAASDIGIANELKRGDSMRSTPKASNSTPSFSQLRKDWESSSNTKNSAGGQKIPHRIFLHTLSHGYVEFSLENENSHDIFMAYLKAHLSSDRIPQRGTSIVNGGGGSNAGSSSGVKHRTASAGGGLLRTMVLTPTKEVPSIESRSTSIEDSTTKSQKSPKLNLPDKDTYDGHAPPPSSPKRRNSKHRPTLVSRDSSSISVCSNKIDKLHSKIINQRIKNESTTFSRVKESFEGWMSSIVDCACCQDTTVAPDPSTVGSNSIQSNKGIVEGTPDSSRMKTSKQRSPTSERLRSKGIGGLSFEVESCPPGSPKLSFEQSMG